jgi:hypothetical protein
MRLDYYILVFAIGLFIGLNINNCKGDKESITIPEQHGSFKPSKPKQAAILPNFCKSKTGKSTDKVYTSTDVVDNSLWQKYEKQIDSVTNANGILLKAYVNAKNDSLRQSMYQKSIEPKLFEQTKEDALVKITASGIVLGTITTLGIDYVRKEQKVEIKPRKLTMYAGAGVGQISNELRPQALVGLQLNEKGIITGQVDTKKNWSIGYVFKF